MIASVVTASHADANTLVLLCKGVQHCSSCAADQRQTNFEWTYTIDFSAGTVDGMPATISDERIVWKLPGTSVSDNREISRYSKRFHFAATPLTGGAEVYSGDGVCEPQSQKAF